MAKPAGRFQIFVLACIVTTSLNFVCAGVAGAIDISDTPLETQINTPPPNLMFVLDNSSSMDFEFMTDEPNGLFEGRFYLFPDDAYLPVSDHNAGSGFALSEPQRRQWRSQWAGYNRIFYNSQIWYPIWPETPANPLGPADLHQPWSNPTNTGSDDCRLRMAAEFFTVFGGTGPIVVPSAHYFTIQDTNANNQLDAGERVYLVTWQDADRNGQIDLGNTAGNDQRRYFRLIDDGDGQVEDDELVPVVNSDEINAIRPKLLDEQGEFQRYATDREELQNFVNWVSFHRRREFAVKATVAAAVINQRQLHVGFYAVNDRPRIAVQPVKLDTSRAMSDNQQIGGDSGSTQVLDETEMLLDALYAMEAQGASALRAAVDQVGRYFDQGQSSKLGVSPYWAEASGGGCQRAFSVVMTDGFWNGTFSGLGNVDGNKGTPYADTWSDTLADIVMYYYDTDLAPRLPDQLPRKGCDEAVHQHLATYSLSFGIEGTIDINDIDGDGQVDMPGYYDDPCFKNASTPLPQWPQPLPNEATVVDDVWHTSVNGRGLYFSADKPETFVAAMSAILSDVGEPASAANVLASGKLLAADSVIYQTRYRSDNWTGDLVALAFNPDTGEIEGDTQQALWRAADQFQQPGVNFDTRRIVTYGGRWMLPQGLAFRYDLLSDAQKKALGSDLKSGSADDRTARAVLDYIRGREFDRFRARSNILGDIVHAAPALAGATLFVGANDGMLHALDADTGIERFAYVPNLVFANLPALSAADYTDRHQFYVDATPSAGQVTMDLFKRNTYLVGGLGKGGKGYFCLLLGQSQRTLKGTQFGPYEEIFSVDRFDAGTQENSVSAIVRWEYPQPEPANDGMDNDGDGFLDEAGEIDPDMGYSFGQGYAVNANTPADTYRPVVIFGNGYDSTSQKAVLYILDADNGRIVRKIDTGFGEDNGLSNPAIIDVDLDRRADYVYAGDLRGNMWKFDLTADDPSQWGVAYGEDLNANGVIDAADGDTPRPLFQARNQPITGRPDVMLVHSACGPQVPGYLVIFGTGRFLGASDRSDISQQSIYGLWDYGDDSDDKEFLGHLTNRSTGALSSGLSLVRQEVVDQRIEDGQVVRELSAKTVDFSTLDDEQDADGISANNTSSAREPNPKQFAGWFFDFPIPPDPNAESGERVTSNVVVRGGNAVVVSFAPSDLPCKGGGNSWLYVIGGCSFTYLPPGEILEAQLPRRIPGLITTNPVVVKETRAPLLDQILITGHRGQITKESFFGEVWGRVSWRQNLQP